MPVEILSRRRPPTRDHSPRRTNHAYRRIPVGSLHVPRRGTERQSCRKVAEITSQQDGTMRQQLIEHLTREIMNSDAEFRSEEATASSGSIARHQQPSRGPLKPRLRREIADALK